jgi:hypothetical protein
MAIIMTNNFSERNVTDSDSDRLTVANFNATSSLLENRNVGLFVNLFDVE